MALQSFLRLSRKGRGFTLVELAIVLAVASLLFAGLWRLMAGGSTQMRDQAAADQMKQLIQATQTYLASSGGQAYLTTNIPAPPGNFVLPLTEATFTPFLPTGFGAGTQNSYGQSYSIQVRRDSASGYSFMIITTGGEQISDTSGGRISGLIGNDGGFIYNTDVCNTQTGGAATNNSACGAYGAWAASVLTYGFAGGASGHLATRTSVVTGTDVSLWLARRNFPTPASEYNTMHTNLYFENAAVPTPPVQPAGTHDLFLGNNVIYGASDTGVIGGRILNVMSAQYGDVSLPGPASQVSLVVNSPCTDTDTINKVNWQAGECKYNAASLNGDVSVTGFLKANSLYAAYFVYETSDERLKHEIKPLENSLEKLSKIRALSFLMNDNNEKKMGVIAQEVEKIYPELIRDIGDGYKGVDYLGFIGPLLGAIQELKAENEELRKQLKSQAQAIKQLQKTEGKGKH